MKVHDIVYCGTAEEVRQCKEAVSQFLEEWYNGNDLLLVHTSGSTGYPKPLWVEKKRMLASARITCDFLGLKQGDTALLCMSLDYIAGKMMMVRTIERGLRLVVVPPSGHPLNSFSSQISFAAMVPMQVYNSLHVSEERERLKHIRHLIIGGGSIDEAMAQELKFFPNAVWSTYGMTETLSHIALRRLSGETASDSYLPFPGVQVSLDTDQCLVIDAPQVCQDQLVTHDIALLEEKDGYQQFRIIGRKDNVICSGGIKIQMEEVEQMLRPVLSMPFMITKKKDQKFGEIVVLLIEDPSVAETTILDGHSPSVLFSEDVFSRSFSSLPAYWHPRQVIAVPRLPMTETGKPARAEAERMVNRVR